MKVRVNKVLTILISSILIISMMGGCPIVEAVEEPKYGGTLIVRHTGDPISFNGFLNYWSVSTRVHTNVYDRLITVNKNREIVPELAKSWEVSEGGKVFTFHLRDDVAWHDGVPFTSADVKWHYETLLLPDMNTYVKPLLEGLQSIEAPDAYTVIFRFDRPKQIVLFGYFQSDTFIHPKHIFEGTDFRTNPANWAPIGTGPFKVTEYVPESHVTFEANENYFRGRPYLDKLIYKIIPDATAALLQFEAGKVQVTVPPTEEIPRLQELNWVNLKWGEPGTTSHRLTFNFRDEAIAKHPWLEDIRVKQAIAHAINKDILIQRAQKGLAIPVDSCLTAGAGWAFNPDVKTYEYDTVKAEQLLDEAGYTRGPDGIRFTIPWITYNRDYAIQSSEVIKEMLKMVGIQIDILPVEYVTYVQLYEHGETGMGDYPITYNHMGGWPPEEIASWMYSRPKGAMNMGFYSNPEVDKLLDEAYSLFDQEERKAKYDEIQDIVAEELPYIFLLATFGATATNKEFDGFETDQFIAGSSWIGYRTAYWTKGVTTIPTPTPTLPPEDIEGLKDALISLTAQLTGVTTQVSDLNQKIVQLETEMQNVSATPISLVYGAIGISVLAILLTIYMEMRKKSV